MHKLLMLEPNEVTEARFRELVNLSISMIPQSTLSGIIDSNRSILANYVHE